MSGSPMADDPRPPVAIRITRPYTTEDEFLEQELDSLSRTSVTLLGAQPRPQGVVLRFELVLSSGHVLMRGEGRVVTFRPNAHHGLGGLTLRFTRLDSRSKALVDKATTLRERRRPSTVPPEPEADRSPAPPPVEPPRPPSPSEPDAELAGHPGVRPRDDARGGPRLEAARAARRPRRPPRAPSIAGQVPRRHGHPAHPRAAEATRLAPGPHPRGARVHPPEARVHPRGASVHPREASVHPHGAGAHPRTTEPRPRGTRPGSSWAYPRCLPDSLPSVVRQHDSPKARPGRLAAKRRGGAQHPTRASLRRRRAAGTTRGGASHGSLRTVT